MARRTFTDTINLNQLGDSFVHDLRATDEVSASAQVTLEQGTWDTAVVELQVSNDGQSYYSLPSVAQLTESGVTPKADVTGYQWLRAVVTTAEGSEGVAHVTLSTNDRTSVSSFDIASVENRLPVTLAAGAQFDLIQRFLDTNGDGTGDVNANGNYSGAEEIFYIQPPPGEVFYIYRMMVAIRDSGGIRFEEYGNIATGLTNGVSIRVQDDSGTKLSLTDAVPILNNAAWGYHSYDVSIASAGSGDDFVSVRWTFARSGQVIRLDGDLNQRFEVVLNDNLTGLIEHRFKVNGYKVPK